MFIGSFSFSQECQSVLSLVVGGGIFGESSISCAETTKLEQYNGTSKLQKILKLLFVPIAFLGK